MFVNSNSIGIVDVIFHAEIFVLCIFILLLSIQANVENMSKVLPCSSSFLKKMPCCCCSCLVYLPISDYRVGLCILLNHTSSDTLSCLLHLFALTINCDPSFSLSFFYYLCHFAWVNQRSHTDLKEPLIPPRLKSTFHKLPSNNWQTKSSDHQSNNSIWLSVMSIALQNHDAQLLHVPVVESSVCCWRRLQLTILLVSPLKKH